MIELYEKMRTELFEQKKVQFHPVLYRKLYHTIFPKEIEQQYCDFISSGNTQYKISIAKQLFNYYRVTERFVIPASFLNSVIADQEERIVSDSSAYVPQDHVIHSVHIYILGIYLFFNVESFHRRILGATFPGRCAEDAIKSFLCKWRMFAFFHDVSYGFEAGVDSEGRFTRNAYALKKILNEFPSSILSQYALRSTARLMTVVNYCFKEAKPCRLQEDSFPESDLWWKDGSERMEWKEVWKQLSMQLWKRPEDFEKTKHLFGIETPEQFSTFLPMLGIQKLYLAVLHDENDRPVDLRIMQGTKTVADYRRSEGTQNLSDGHEYRFHYLIPNIEECLCDSLPDANYLLVRNWAEALPERIDAERINMKGPNRLFLEIFHWLFHKLHMAPNGTVSDVFDSTIQEYYREAAIQELSDNLAAMLREKEFCIRQLIPKEIAEKLNAALKNLTQKKKMNEISEHIQKQAAENYNKATGVPNGLIKYYEKMMVALKKWANETDCIEQIRFLTLQPDGEVELKLFSHHDPINSQEHYLFEHELYHRIEQLAKESEINIQDLLDYKTDYTACDHGLVSAGLLFQSIVIGSYLADYCKQKPSLLFAWNEDNCETLFSAERAGEYAEVIFAVLLHNIYHRDSRNYGIDYCQTLDRNPFSYFCAFCDSLQKWDRSKQISLAKTDLPQHHYLNPHFSLTVENGQIILLCDERYVSPLTREIQSNEIFLKGVSGILKVRAF